MVPVHHLHIHNARQTYLNQMAADDAKNANVKGDEKTCRTHCGSLTSWVGLHFFKSPCLATIKGHVVISQLLTCHRSQVNLLFA